MLVRSAISIIDSALVNWRKTTHAMFLTHIQYINLHYPTHIHVWQFCIRTIFSTKIQASYGRLSREPLVLWQHRLFPTFTQVCTRTCRHWIKIVIHNCSFILPYFEGWTSSHNAMLPTANSTILSYKTFGSDPCLDLNVCRGVWRDDSLIRACVSRHIYSVLMLLLRSNIWVSSCLSFIV